MVEKLDHFEREDDERRNQAGFLGFLEALQRPSPQNGRNIWSDAIFRVDLTLRQNRTDAPVTESCTIDFHSLRLTRNLLRNLFPNLVNSPCICKESISIKLEKNIECILPPQALSTHPPLSRTYHRRQAESRDPKQQNWQMWPEIRGFGRALRGAHLPRCHFCWLLERKRRSVGDATIPTLKQEEISFEDTKSI